MIATPHFKFRVAERLGNIDPDVLAREVVYAIERGLEDRVQFISRVSRCGRRLFRVILPGLSPFYVVLNTKTMACLTVLLEGHVVKREGMSPLTLGAGS